MSEHQEHRRTSPVLVGRTAELSTLRDALASPPGIVVVDGEAGVGKSRLVGEAVGGTRGARTLVGHCQPVREPYPLGTVLDALNGLVGTLPSRTRANPALGPLAPYLPELAGRLPPAPAPLSDQQAERHRLLRAVVALLSDLGPTVLVLEDVHWADAGTLELLGLLASSLPDGLVVVLTVRSEARGQLPVWEALARARPGPAVQVRLHPLPREEVGQLARRILDADALQDRFVAALYEQTAGIPFVVEEVLAGLTSAGTPPPGGNGAIAVPASLHDLVLHRWESLEPVGRDVLGAAAVLGVDVDVELVGRVAGCDAGTVARALGDAVTAGLLHDDGPGCRFRHALAQQAVYEVLPQPVRRWLHLRAAEALDRTGGDGTRPVARLAYHYRLAGRTTEFVRNAEAAADLALAHGDEATGATFLLPTVAVAEVPVADRVRLAGKLGRAAVGGLAQATAVPVLDDLLADPRLPVERRGELRFLLGRLLRQQGDARRGYEEIERAAAELGHDAALRARALAILAVPDIVTGPHVRQHRARAEEARQAARRSGADGVRVAVGIASASLHLELGDPRGWRLVEELGADPALVAEPREHARACLNWAQNVLHLGYVSRAESLLGRARQLTDEAEYLRVAGVVDLITGWVDLAAGRWAGLEERAHGLVRDSSAFGAAGLDARFLVASVLARLGDADEALALVGEVVAAAQRVGAVRPLVPAGELRARLLLTSGDAEGAAEEAGRCLDEVRAKGLWPLGAEAAGVAVDALVALGRVSSARDVVAELAAGLGTADAPAAQAALAVCRSAVADSSHGGEACSLVASAREAYERLGLPYEHALATARLGRLLVRAGAAARGAGPLEEALRAFAALGAGRDVAAVRRTMRVHRVPVPYPWRGGRRSYGSALSPREHEVAALAADGRTNEEIAVRLCLSRRTVESHVASALRKLGGRSRRELADLLGAGARS